MPRSIEKLSVWLIGAVLLMHIASKPADAVTPGMIPGDTFFLSALSESDVQSLPQTGGTVQFDYRPPLEWLNMCGYVGIWSLSIEEMSAADIERLQMTYLAMRLIAPKAIRIFIRQDGTEESYEANPFHLLIYPRSFDTAKWILGLKYNENWQKTWRTKQFFGKDIVDDPAIYRSLIPEYEATVEDWRNAAAVPQLQFQSSKDMQWDLVAGDRLKEPAVVKYSDVVLYLVPFKGIPQLYHREDESRFIKIDGESITESVWKKMIDEETEEIELKLVSRPFDLSQAREIELKRHSRAGAKQLPVGTR